MASSDPLETDAEQRLALQQRLECAARLLSKAEDLKRPKRIQGMQRITKQIQSEMSMLKNLVGGLVEVKTHHMMSTNLLHLEALLHICEHALGVVGVEQRVAYVNTSGPANLTVDVVAHQGSCWVKVFARKRQALHRKWLGDGEYGDKTVTDFADEYIIASQQNTQHYSAPLVVFAFFDGITRSIADALTEMSVSVVGPVYADDSEEAAPSPLQVAAMFTVTPQHSSPLTIPAPQTISSEREIINLDVSSMLSWVSQLTHGGAQQTYEDLTLNEMSQNERHSPLLPQLLSATEGRSLIACATALTDFKSIIAVTAGPRERQRAEQLLDRIKPVDDSPSERSLQLSCSGKIKPRSKVIFGTGDFLKATTLTANEGFVRAAVGQGVKFAVVIHACRALSERAEKGTNSDKHSKPIT